MIASLSCFGTSHRLCKHAFMLTCAQSYCTLGLSVVGSQMHVLCREECTIMCSKLVKIKILIMTVHFLPVPYQ